MTYSPLTDPFRQWDPYAVCPRCGVVPEYNCCGCGGDGRPTEPLIPSVMSWKNGTALLPVWSKERGCWISQDEAVKSLSLPLAPKPEVVAEGAHPGTVPGAPQRGLPNE